MYDQPDDDLTPTPPEHDHSKQPKVWCLTHNCKHIATIPRFTYHCKFCGWGQWYKEDALAHEADCPGHETFEVEHLIRVSPPVEPETIERVIGPVLFNVMNFPESVQSRLLGQDMKPLRDKLIAALLDPVSGVFPTPSGDEPNAAEMQRRIWGISDQAPASPKGDREALDLEPIKVQLPRLHDMDERMRDNLDSRHAEVHLAALRIGNLIAEVEQLRAVAAGLAVTPNPEGREYGVIGDDGFVWPHFAGEATHWRKSGSLDEWQPLAAVTPNPEPRVLKLRPNPDMPSDETLHQLRSDAERDPREFTAGLRAIWRHGCDAGMAAAVTPNGEQAAPDWEWNVSYSDPGAPSVDGYRMRRSYNAEDEADAQRFAATALKPIITKRTREVKAGEWIPVAASYRAATTEQEGPSA